MKKPSYVSDVEIKDKPLVRFVCLLGSGDPLYSFDEKRNSVTKFLKKNNIQIDGNSFGIYYVDRRKSGVGDVRWDVCIPVKKKVNIEEPFKYKEIFDCKVSSVVLTGGYELIGDALRWMEFRLEEMDIKAEWPLIEIYINENGVPITELQYAVI